MPAVTKEAHDAIVEAQKLGRGLESLRKRSPELFQEITSQTADLTTFDFIENADGSITITKKLTPMDPTRETATHILCEKDGVFAWHPKKRRNVNGTFQEGGGK